MGVVSVHYENEDQAKKGREKRQEDERKVRKSEDDEYMEIKGEIYLLWGKCKTGRDRR